MTIDCAKRAGAFTRAVGSISTMSDASLAGNGENRAAEWKSQARLAEKELDGAGDIIDVGKAAQSATPYDLLALAEPPGHFRMDKARRYGIHGDAQRSNFASERTRKTDKRRLGCTINRKA